MSKSPAVGNASSITLNFALFLEDGQEIDSNFDGNPVEMKMGDGNMLPGFEQHLLGLQEGGSVEVTVPAEDAFGPHNKENLQRFKASDFATDMTLEKGLMISFADPAGGELTGVVDSLENEWVMVDFNHPLAGRDIVFKATVHSIQRVE